MVTLLGMDHGRWGYAEQSLATLDALVGPDFFDRRVFSFDGVAPEDVPSFVDGEVICSPIRKGLSHNIAQAWDALHHGEWVFHLELDFLIHDLPLDAMRTVLEETPYLAQMVLERQPVNPAEFANGGLLGADNIPTWADCFLSPDMLFPPEDGPTVYRYRTQSHLFSFNPHLRRHDRTLFPHGWGGTETEATERLRGPGWVFGFWGAQGDAPRCAHIGTEGGMGSAGWAA